MMPCNVVDRFDPAIGSFETAVPAYQTTCCDGQLNEDVTFHVDACEVDQVAVTGNNSTRLQMHSSICGTKTISLNNFLQPYQLTFCTYQEPSDQ
jgi:hypothetical protein